MSEEKLEAAAVPQAETTPEQAPIGAELRRARESRQLSVNEVANALKISVRQVEALEADQWERLPGRTFVRGFVRNYARYLHLDGEAMQELCAQAPKLIDYLGEASLAHFEGVQQILKDAGVPFTINPRLVRGLDYYNLTVFEWVTEQLGAQGTVCAGGRYDSLVEQLGGKATPACGFAMGVERLVALLQDQNLMGQPTGVDVYVVHQGEQAGRLAPRVAEGLRDAGMSVVLHCGGGSFKSQMKKADGSGAAYAVIIGDDEAAAGEVTLKVLRSVGEEKPEQLRVKVDDLAQTLMDSIIDWDEE